ncbi:MAG TPA: Stf0 family sulfotransferase [Solirubrobacteraceae bacterium]|jgi:LPS sulfotransferase NodH
MLSYLVCATPRSGSTLLCELLKHTNVAGRPEEYFEAKGDTGRPPHPGDYLENLPRTGAGIRDDQTPPRAPAHSSLIGMSDYHEHLKRTFELGTTPNGVFGTKMMWRHLPELHALAGELPEYSGLELYDLLTRLFDEPRYVWVTRRDKVRQAVSLWRALQTRSWRMERERKEGEEATLTYRFEGVDYLVKGLHADDEGWQAYFDQHRIPVLKVVYEDDLERDPEGTVRSVIDHVGAELDPGWHPAEKMQRQADQLSDEWVAAYHRDAAQAAGAVLVGR